MIPNPTEIVNFEPLMKTSSPDLPKCHHIGNQRPDCLEQLHFCSGVLGAMPTAAVGMFFQENNGMATLRGHGTRYTGDGNRSSTMVSDLGADYKREGAKTS
jgi:hypothetical protein